MNAERDGSNGKRSLTCQLSPKKGDVFTHQSYLDKLRRPARMKVTRVTQSAVYFTYADSPGNKGAFYLDRSVWLDRYGNP